MYFTFVKKKKLIDNENYQLIFSLYNKIVCVNRFDHVGSETRIVKKLKFLHPISKNHIVCMWF